MGFRNVFTTMAAVLAVTAGAAGTTAASAAPATRYHYAHPYVLYMVNRNAEAMKVRPGRINVLRPGLTLSRLRWQSWNARSAKGRGYALDSNGRSPVHVTISHPVWTPAPDGPDRVPDLQEDHRAREQRVLPVHVASGLRGGRALVFHQALALGTSPAAQQAGAAGADRRVSARACPSPVWRVTLQRARDLTCPPSARAYARKSRG